MQQNRENWTAVINNGRYIVIDKITNAHTDEMNTPNQNGNAKGLSEG